MLRLPSACSLPASYSEITNFMKISSQNGSILAVAMMFAIAMAVAVVGFLSLTTSTLVRANRSFYYNSAVNLAEAGAEEALWALNNSDWSKRAWSSGANRTLLGSSASPDMTDQNKAVGYYNVYVEGASGSAPTITAEAVIKAATGAPVKKQIRLYAKNANVFLPPFTAIKDMDLNGGEIDSYDMTAGDYTKAPRKYNTTVASPTVKINDVSIGSPADIYGNVSVGISSSDASAFISTIKGSITGPTTTASGSGVVKSGSNLIDTNRIAYDFVQDFPSPTTPSTSGAYLSLPAADSNGYIVIGDSSATPTTQTYSLTSVSLKTGETLLIVGPVNIVVSGAFSMSGQAALAVLAKNFTLSSKSGSTTYTGSTLANASVYVNGDMSVSGNGSAIGLDLQSSDPAALKFYGTNPTSQNLSVGGNGNLAAAIYAPKADATFNGGGSSGYFAGAIVANTITVNGNGYRVRFPEQLANLATNSTYKVSKWVELTDRSDWHTF